MVVATRPPVVVKCGIKQLQSEHGEQKNRAYDLARNIPTWMDGMIYVPFGPGATLENGSVRPKTPLYQVVSIDLSHQISPASSIDPQGTEQSMVNQINNALASKGLVP